MHISNSKVVEFLEIHFVSRVWKGNDFTGISSKKLSGSRRFPLLIWGYESICEIIQKKIQETDIFHNMYHIPNLY